jgi:hypothetical protein
VAEVFALALAPGDALLPGLSPLDFTRTKVSQRFGE